MFVTSGNFEFPANMEVYFEKTLCMYREETKFPVTTEIYFEDTMHVLS